VDRPVLSSRHADACREPMTVPFEDFEEKRTHMGGL
jgi:hypothetical protein